MSDMPDHIETDDAIYYKIKVQEGLKGIRLDRAYVDKDLTIRQLHDIIYPALVYGDNGVCLHFF